MSSGFVFPDWMARAEPAPAPNLAAVDPYRVEDFVNRFIAAKHNALFEAPDAFYRRTRTRRR